MRTVTQTTALAGHRRMVGGLLACALVLAAALPPGVGRGDHPAPVAGRAPRKATTRPATRPASRPARKNVKLPGFVVNLEKRHIDLEATVCLDQGLLELIACTKGTKEHESIVAIEARPMHVHAALLLLGANSGNPAMRKPIDEQGTRWVDVPPRGDPVDVTLVFRDAKGKLVERPVSDFVTRSGKGLDGKPAAGEDTDDDVAFGHTFLFAGSLIRGKGPGPRKYLCDLSGNVISIATFGDELLCLPGIHGRQNASLMWQVNPTGLPKVGSKVTLRLRPKLRPAGKTGTTSRPRPDRPPAKRKP